MNSGALKGAWKIMTIMGIPIRVHFSWLIVFGLITWSLASRFFPEAAPDLPIIYYWIKGGLAAVLLFASVAFHELAHSFVAKLRLPWLGQQGLRRSDTPLVILIKGFRTPISASPHTMRTQHIY